MVKQQEEKFGRLLSEQGEKQIGRLMVKQAEESGRLPSEQEEKQTGRLMVKQEEEFGRQSELEETQTGKWKLMQLNVKRNQQSYY